MSEDISRPGPGSVLKSTRESLGYTEQDIADALNLTVRAVGDLEAERWERFHALTFARGYVKAYGKLLGLDGDALVRDYAGFRETSTVAPSAKIEASLFDNARGQIANAFQRQPGTVLSAAVVLAICVVAAVLIFVWPESQEPTNAVRRPPTLPLVPKRPESPPRTGTAAPVIATPTASEPTVAPPPAPAVEQIEAAQPAGEGSMIRPDAQLVEAPPATSPANADAESLDTLARTLSGESESVRRLTPAGDERLDLAFTDDCWVEIKDVNGRNLYSDLARAGATLAFVGQGPFRILLGYGPAVTLAFNGAPVPLRSYTRNNVASLVVGG